MLEARSDSSPAGTIVIEREGRYFCYEPGLALVASDDSVERAYGKFVAAKQDLIDQARSAGLALSHPAPVRAAKTESLRLQHRGFFAELGLFLAKTAVVLLVIAGIGGAAAMGIKGAVDRTVAAVAPEISKSLQAFSGISIMDVAGKASVIVADFQRMPPETKESLRQNIGILSRELAPFVDAWRNPPESAGGAVGQPGGPAPSR